MESSCVILFLSFPHYTTNIPILQIFGLKTFVFILGSIFPTYAFGLNGITLNLE